MCGAQSLLGQQAVAQLLVAVMGVEVPDLLLRWLGTVQRGGRRCLPLLCVQPSRAQVRHQPSLRVPGPRLCLDSLLCLIPCPHPRVTCAHAGFARGPQHNCLKHLSCPRPCPGSGLHLKVTLLRAFLHVNLDVCLGSISQGWFWSWFLAHQSKAWSWPCPTSMLNSFSCFNPSP